MPADAGIQGRATGGFPWIPACAGMTPNDSISSKPALASHSQAGDSPVPGLRRNRHRPARLGDPFFRRRMNWIACPKRSMTFDGARCEMADRSSLLAISAEIEQPSRTISSAVNPRRVAAHKADDLICTEEQSRAGPCDVCAGVSDYHDLICAGLPGGKVNRVGIVNKIP